MNLTVRIKTSNPAALDQLKAHLEAFPLDTDVVGNLHPLTVSITGDDGAVLWASVWAPESDTDDDLIGY